VCPRLYRLDALRVIEPTGSKTLKDNGVMVGRI